MSSTKTTGLAFERVQEETDCSRCGDTGKDVVLAVASDSTGRTRSRSALCSDCLVIALESVTGFQFSNTLSQWRRMSEQSEDYRNETQRSSRSKRRERERRASRRQMREQVNDQ